MTTIDPIAHPLRIYKYVTPDRIDVLQNLTIRFTQPDALNDPFELKPLARMISKEELESFLATLDALDKGCKTLDEIERGVACTIQSSEASNGIITCHRSIKDTVAKLKNYVESERLRIIGWDKMRTSHYKTKFDELVSRYGILSLSSSVTNPNLWAHYALNSKGFVYEFDTSNSYFLNSLIGVRYADRDPAIRVFTDLNREDLFFTKARSWAYEAEFRMVGCLKKAKTKLTVNGEEIYLFDIPASALTRVIVGANANSDLIGSIRNIIRSREELSHIEVAKIQINFESYSLDIVPL